MLQAAVVLYICFMLKVYFDHTLTLTQVFTLKFYDLRHGNLSFVPVRA